MVVAVMVMVAVVAFFPCMQRSWGGGGGGWFHESFPAWFFSFFISNVAVSGDQFMCISATL